ncbi:DNA topoisomerase 1-like [Scaptodrosophila lebanonensis]|uniref:DNA topoisomerase I n=1 Tax=Drosophila lebanonensis TaxID=7225 RepID=A0A6J2TEA1_DROLE|nr:DNA topoisomerase 1-like [Scaptodrosophila lebanonensis]
MALSPYKFVPIQYRRGNLDILSNWRGLMKRKSLRKILALDLPSHRSSMLSDWHRELGITGFDDNIKWRTLKHNGPVFPPPYRRLPPNVHFYYDSQPFRLSEAAEEAATFYAKILNTDFVNKPTFRINFFHDFCNVLDPCERRTIQEFSLCDFSHIHKYFVEMAEKKRRASNTKKAQLKAIRHAEAEKFGFCEIDGFRERISNYRIEPPGIFRGRGMHPKMGMLKARIDPEEVAINCSPGAEPAPPCGHQWKAIKHDNSVSWLACWKDRLHGQTKYIILNSGARQQGIRDLNKFETARRLSHHIAKIREAYRTDWNSSDLMERQRGVAMYFIDVLALRAGNEKDGYTADTVGCCTLRVEHMHLYDILESVPHVVIFNFLGKDSIRFCKKIALDMNVYHNLKNFILHKALNDLVFHLLSTQKLNEHLKTLMDGLTAKVFRTYNASVLLQCRLDRLTLPELSVDQKIDAYNKANAEAALLCNHQRLVPKSCINKLGKWEKQIIRKRTEIARQECLCYTSEADGRPTPTKADIRSLTRLRRQLCELEEKRDDTMKNSNIALITSKVNYLDPRITVAWCKKHSIPIDKIFNASLQNKFKWAIRATDQNFRF